LNFGERVHTSDLLALEHNGAVGEIKMKAYLKRKPHTGDDDCVKRARRHQEEALDNALKNTFPASDPVSIEQPARGGSGKVRSAEHDRRV
jgi:hypothetical protein